MRKLLAAIILILFAAGGAWVLAGRAAGPAIEIHQPAKLVGRSTPLDVTVQAPGGTLSAVRISIEQNGQSVPLFSLDQPAQAETKQEDAERLRITRRVGRESLPALEPGPLRLVVTASRPVLYGWRTVESTATRDLTARFEPPRVTVESTHHFINHGGAELVLYRVTPADVDSGVAVGDVRYPGYPAAGAGVTGADPSLRVAFFALLHDQDLGLAPEVRAVDEAGNEARAAFDHRLFPKPFRRSRIQLDEPFLRRVVPAILERTPELKVQAPTDDESLLAAFLAINRDLRERNAERIRQLAAQSARERLWDGAFQQLGSSKVEAGFADHRTYFYKGREVDQQVHLGFDLAVTANVPVRAANRGRVLFADYLGIYGNAVIIDHGLGVQSLYGHLSSLDTRAGDQVEKAQVIGRSGMTGLAGGDHLHFTMLLQGHPVSPVEWWDPHWIEDRILRKIKAAGGGAS